LFSNQIREPRAENQDTDVLDVKAAEELNEGDKSSDFYSLFISDLARLAVEPINIDALSEKMGLHKFQVADWITRSLNDGYIKKLNHRV